MATGGNNTCTAAELNETLVIMRDEVKECQERVRRTAAEFMAVFQSYMESMMYVDVTDDEETKDSDRDNDSDSDSDDDTLSNETK